MRKDKELRKISLEIYMLGKKNKLTFGEWSVILWDINAELISDRIGPTTYNMVYQAPKRKK